MTIKCTFHYMFAMDYTENGAINGQHLLYNVHCIYSIYCRWRNMGSIRRCCEFFTVSVLKFYCILHPFRTFGSPIYIFNSHEPFPALKEGELAFRFRVKSFNNVEIKFFNERHHLNCVGKCAFSLPHLIIDRFSMCTV